MDRCLACWSNPCKCCKHSNIEEITYLGFKGTKCTNCDAPIILEIEIEPRTSLAGLVVKLEESPIFQSDDQA